MAVITIKPTEGGDALISVKFAVVTQDFSETEGDASEGIDRSKLHRTGTMIQGKYGVLYGKSCGDIINVRSGIHHEMWKGTHKKLLSCPYWNRITTAEGGFQLMQVTFSTFKISCPTFN